MPRKYWKHRNPSIPLPQHVLMRVEHEAMEDCRVTGGQAEEAEATMTMSHDNPRGNVNKGVCWDTSTVVGQDTETGASGGCTIRGQASEVLRLHRHMRSVHSRASMAALLTQLSSVFQPQKPVPLP